MNLQHTDNASHLADQSHAARYRRYGIKGCTDAERLGELAILWMGEPGWIAIGYVYLHARLAVRAGAAQLDSTEDR